MLGEAWMKAPSGGRRKTARRFSWIAVAMLTLMFASGIAGGSALASQAATPVVPGEPTWSIAIGYSGYDQAHLDSPITVTVTIRGSGLTRDQPLNFTTTLPADLQSMVVGTSCTPTVAGSTCSFGGGFSSADNARSLTGVVTPAANGDAGAVVGFTISGLQFLDPLLGTAACLHVNGPDGLTTTCSDIFIVPADVPTMTPTIAAVEPIVTPTSAPGASDPLATEPVANASPAPIPGNGNSGSAGSGRGSTSSSSVVALPNTGTASVNHDDTLSYILIGASLILVMFAAGVALNRRQV
jgi:hypothetical protein